MKKLELDAEQTERIIDLVREVGAAAILLTIANDHQKLADQLEFEASLTYSAAKQAEAQEEKRLKAKFLALAELAESDELEFEVVGG